MKKHLLIFTATALIILPIFGCSAKSQSKITPQTAVSATQLAATASSSQIASQKSRTAVSSFSKVSSSSAVTSKTSSAAASKAPVSSSIPVSSMAVSSAATSSRVVQNGKIPFGSKFIWTDYNSKTPYPATVVLRSVAELKEYAKTYQPGLNFETAIEKYNDAYFEQNVIICIRSAESSSGYTLRVAGVTGDKALNVKIERTKPSGVTLCVMQGWHILLEISKADSAEKPVELQITTVTD